MVLYYAFGVNVACGKGERGLRVTWIGVVFELDLAREVMQLTISRKMANKLQAKLKDWAGVGMIGLRELRAITGRLWMAGILPRARWAVSMLYAVVAAAEKDAASGAEEAHSPQQHPTQNRHGCGVALRR